MRNSDGVTNNTKALKTYRMLKVRVFLPISGYTVETTQERNTATTCNRRPNSYIPSTKPCRCFGVIYKSPFSVRKPLQRQWSNTQQHLERQEVIDESSTSVVFACTNYSRSFYVTCAQSAQTSGNV